MDTMHVGIVENMFPIILAVIATLTDIPLGLSSGLRLEHGIPSMTFEAVEL
jgi:hypothetical protein